MGKPGGYFCASHSVLVCNIDQKPLFDFGYFRYMHTHPNTHIYTVIHICTYTYSHIYTFTHNHFVNRDKSQYQHSM